MGRRLGILLLPLIVVDALASLPLGTAPYLGDMTQFLVSEHAAILGQNPYAFLDTGLIFGQPTLGTNLNPPVSLLLFAPLAALPAFTVIRLWTCLTLLLYGLSVAGLLFRYRQHLSLNRILLALSLGGLWFTVVFGQVYVVIVVFAVGAWLLLDRGSDLAAGILIGVVTALKPNFGVWLALLWLAGHRKTAYAGIASGAALTILPALIYGPEVYLEWYQAQGVEAPMIGWWPHNGSFYGLVARIGAGWLAYPLIAAFLLFVGWWVWRSRPSALAVSSVALAASLFASPLAWMGYDLFLVPVLFSQRWSPLLRGAVAFMIVPAWLTWDLAPGPTWGMVLVSIVSTAPLLLTLVATMRSARFQEGAPHSSNGSIAGSARILPQLTVPNHGPGGRHAGTYCQAQ